MGAVAAMAVDLSRRPRQLQRMIYKLFLASEWAELQADGATHGAPIDLADGYIHFSDRGTVAETAEKYFADVADLWLISVDPDRLGDDLRWEAARGGALFPHLYRDLRLPEVADATPVPLVDGRHHFPPLA